MGERVIFEAIVTGAPAVEGLRLATPSDLPWLEDIAATAFIESRFFRDPNFSRASSESLFRTWIRKSVEGWARAVLVADQQGFVTCRDEKIDLLAVTESARGVGVGAALTKGANHWFATQGVRRVSVLARADNAAAVNLYKRCGFIPALSEFVFHKWYR
jgi:dTDP-4-amino-4,6-dideoxy-D-galactose acyltransferase